MFQLCNCIKFYEFIYTPYFCSLLNKDWSKDMKDFIRTWFYNMQMTMKGSVC